MASVETSSSSGPVSYAVPKLFPVNGNKIRGVKISADSIQACQKLTSKRHPDKTEFNIPVPQQDQPYRVLATSDREGSVYLQIKVKGSGLVWIKYDPQMTLTFSLPNADARKLYGSIPQSEFRYTDENGLPYASGITEEVTSNNLVTGETSISEPLTYDTDGNLIPNSGGDVDGDDIVDEVDDAPNTANPQMAESGEVSVTETRMEIEGVTVLPQYMLHYWGGEQGGVELIPYDFTNVGMSGRYQLGELNIHGSANYFLRIPDSDYLPGFITDLYDPYGNLFNLDAGLEGIVHNNANTLVRLGADGGILSYSDQTIGPKISVSGNAARAIKEWRIDGYLRGQMLPNPYGFAINSYQERNITTYGWDETTTTPVGSQVVHNSYDETETTNGTIQYKTRSGFSLDHSAQITGPFRRWGGMDVGYGLVLNPPYETSILKTNLWARYKLADGSFYFTVGGQGGYAVYGDVTTDGTTQRQVPWQDSLSLGITQTGGFDRNSWGFRESLKTSNSEVRLEGSLILHLPWKLDATVTGIGGTGLWGVMDVVPTSLPAGVKQPPFTGSLAFSLSWRIGTIGTTAATSIGYTGSDANITPYTVDVLAEGSTKDDKGQFSAKASHGTQLAGNELSDILQGNSVRYDLLRPAPQHMIRQVPIARDIRSLLINFMQWTHQTDLGEIDSDAEQKLMLQRYYALSIIEQNLHAINLSLGDISAEMFTVPAGVGYEKTPMTFGDWLTHIAAEKGKLQGAVDLYNAHQDVIKSTDLRALEELYKDSTVTVNERQIIVSRILDLSKINADESIVTSDWSTAKSILLEMKSWTDQLTDTDKKTEWLSYILPAFYRSEYESVVSNLAAQLAVASQSPQPNIAPEVRIQAYQAIHTLFQNGIIDQINDHYLPVVSDNAQTELNRLIRCATAGAELTDLIWFQYEPEIYRSAHGNRDMSVDDRTTKIIDVTNTVNTDKAETLRPILATFKTDYFAQDTIRVQTEISGKTEEQQLAIIDDAVARGNTTPELVELLRPIIAKMFEGITADISAMDEQIKKRPTLAAWDDEVTKPIFTNPTVADLKAKYEQIRQIKLVTEQDMPEEYSRLIREMGWIDVLVSVENDITGEQKADSSKPDKPGVRTGSRYNANNSILRVLQEIDTFYVSLTPGSGAGASIVTKTMFTNLQGKFLLTQAEMGTREAILSVIDDPNALTTVDSAVFEEITAAPTFQQEVRRAAETAADPKKPDPLKALKNLQLLVKWAQRCAPDQADLLEQIEQGRETAMIDLGVLQDPAQLEEGRRLFKEYLLLTTGKLVEHVSAMSDSGWSLDQKISESEKIADFIYKCGELQIKWNQHGVASVAFNVGFKADYAEMVKTYYTGLSALLTAEYDAVYQNISRGTSWADSSLAQNNINTQTILLITYLSDKNTLQSSPIYKADPFVSVMKEKNTRFYSAWLDKQSGVPNKDTAWLASTNAKFTALKAHTENLPHNIDYQVTAEVGAIYIPRVVDEYWTPLVDASKPADISTSIQAMAQWVIDQCDALGIEGDTKTGMVQKSLTDIINAYLGKILAITDWNIFSTQFKAACATIQQISARYSSLKLDLLKEVVITSLPQVSIMAATYLDAQASIAGNKLDSTAVIKDFKTIIDTVKKSFPGTTVTVPDSGLVLEAAVKYELSKIKPALSTTQPSTAITKDQTAILAVNTKISTFKSDPFWQRAFAEEQQWYGEFATTYVNAWLSAVKTDQTQWSTLFASLETLLKTLNEKKLITENVYKALYLSVSDKAVDYFTGKAQFTTQLQHFQETRTTLQDAETTAREANTKLLADVNTAINSDGTPKPSASISSLIGLLSDAKAVQAQVSPQRSTEIEETDLPQILRAIVLSLVAKYSEGLSAFLGAINAIDTGLKGITITTGTKITTENIIQDLLEYLDQESSRIQDDPDQGKVEGKLISNKHPLVIYLRLAQYLDAQIGKSVNSGSGGSLDAGAASGQSMLNNMSRSIFVAHGVSVASTAKHTVKADDVDSSLPEAEDAVISSAPDAIARTVALLDYRISQIILRDLEARQKKDPVNNGKVQVTLVELVAEYVRESSWYSRLSELTYDPATTPELGGRYTDDDVFDAGTGNICNQQFLRELQDYININQNRLVNYDRQVQAYGIINIKDVLGTEKLHNPYIRLDNATIDKYYLEVRKNTIKPKLEKLNAFNMADASGSGRTTESLLSVYKIESGSSRSLWSSLDVMASNIDKVIKQVDEVLALQKGETGSLWNALNELKKMLTDVKTIILELKAIRDKPESQLTYREYADLYRKITALQEKILEKDDDESYVNYPGMQNITDTSFLAFSAADWRQALALNNGIGTGSGFLEELINNYMFDLPRRPQAFTNAGNKQTLAQWAAQEQLIYAQKNNLKTKDQFKAYFTAPDVKDFSNEEEYIKALLISAKNAVSKSDTASKSRILPPDADDLKVEFSAQVTLVEEGGNQYGVIDPTGIKQWVINTASKDPYISPEVIALFYHYLTTVHLPTNWLTDGADGKELNVRIE